MKTNYRYLLAGFFCIILLNNCAREKRCRKKIVDRKIVESCFLNDSVYDGVTRFYSLTGNILDSEIVFTNGIKNGYQKFFYNSGVLRESLAFCKDVVCGDHTTFDRHGNIASKKYFFNGESIGGRFYYKGGLISRYEFLGFDRNIQFKAVYDNKGTLTEFGGNFVALDYREALPQDSSAYALIAYLPRPPELEINYGIGVYDSSTRAKKIIDTIPKSQREFKKLDLPPLGKGKSYYFQAHCVEPGGEFDKVYIRFFG